MVLGGGGGQGSRTSLRNAGAGEIVEVPGGGRIVRSTAGRKDRHSKVCTAKGPRDRRVRLAAHTAIQFYDVQDRLGYDRPSKAVDWLMKKAKSAIDALDEPPTWKPVSRSPEREATEAYEGSLLPPSMESDSIADTIKSFFPMGGGDGDSEGQTLQFQSYPSSDLMAMRDCSQSQDLKLSLQSLQDPMMIQSHHNNNRHSNQEENQQRSHFPGASQIGFDNPSGGGGGGWGDESHHQPRLIGWNFGGYGNGGSGGGGFMFIPPQTSLQQQHQQQQQQLLFTGHDSGGQSSSHLFPQGGPLQSNYTPLVTNTTSSHDHHHDHTVLVHPMSLPGIGLSSSGGFSGFRIPARIQGDEDQDGNKPFSLSSGSRH